MARNLDELRGASVALRQAAMSKEVQLWLKELNALAHDRLQQDYVAKGEEAVRGMGFQQAIGLCNSIADIFEHSVKQAEENNRHELAKKLKM